MCVINTDMKGTIQHYGTIRGIEGKHVIVRILQASACSSCSAASLCRSSETKEKDLDIWDEAAANRSVGDSVKIEGSVGQGLWATWWGYGAPLVLLVGVLMIGVECTGSEGWSALLALGTLVPYYIVLYLMRGKLQRQLTFRIVDSKTTI